MTKTPLTALNELCKKVKAIANYCVDRIPNSKEFQCCLTLTDPLEEVHVTANGKTKKDSKHAAAYEALRIIFNSNIRLQDELIKEQLEWNNIEFPASTSLDENYVWKLHAICIKNLLTIPEYFLIKTEGKDIKTFTMECRVSSVKEAARSLNKKTAKQYAAEFMIHKLTSFLNLDLDVSAVVLDFRNQIIKDVNDNNSIEIKHEPQKIEIWNENTRKDWVQLIANSKHNISEYHNTLTTEIEYFFLNYKSVHKFTDYKSIKNPRGLIEEISGNTKQKFSFYNFGNFNGQNITALILLSPTPLVVIEMSSNLETAEDQLCCKMLSLLSDLVTDVSFNCVTNGDTKS